MHSRGPIETDYAEFQGHISLENFRSLLTFHQEIIVKEAQDRVELNVEFIHILMNYLNKFLLQVAEKFWNYGEWADWGSYVSKEICGRMLGGAASYPHSFLIFTKSEEFGKFYVIIKSNFQIVGKTAKSAEDREKQKELSGDGGYKIVKIYSFLLSGKFQFGHDYSNFYILEAEPIVTWGRPTQVKTRNFADKRDHLNQLMTHETRSLMFEGWDILEFINTSGADAGLLEPRLLLYQPKAGKIPCGDAGEQIALWADDNPQRMIGIESFLAGVKKILQGRYWPVDLKFGNMCLNFKRGRPEINLIDFTGSSITFSLFKQQISLADKHPNPFFSAVQPGMFIKGLLMLNQRSSSRPALSDGVFKYFLFQFFFEVAYNVFFIWLQGRHPGNKTADGLLIYYAGAPQQSFLCFLSHVINPMWSDLHRGKDRDLVFFLDKYINRQDPSLDAARLIQDFFTDLTGVIQKLKSSYGLLPMEFVDSDGVLVLSPEWNKSFSQLLFHFRSTENPYQKPKIRKLEMIPL